MFLPTMRGFGGWKPSEAATVGDDAKFLAELRKRVQVGPVGKCEYGFVTETM